MESSVEDRGVNSNAMPAETETPNSELPLEAALYMIHHVFLPPKLPNDDDTNAVHERILLDFTLSLSSRVQKLR